jgi:hypothetical protein
MGIAYVDRRTRAVGAGALLSLSLSLSGCVTSTAGSSALDARAEAPAPASVYLPVEELPPKRDQPAMTVDEQSKLKKDLIAARNRQATSAKVQGNASSAQPVKPHAVQPNDPAVRQ